MNLITCVGMGFRRNDIYNRKPKKRETKIWVCFQDNKRRTYRVRKIYINSLILTYFADIFHFSSSRNRFCALFVRSHERMLKKGTTSSDTEKVSIRYCCREDFKWNRMQRGE